MRFPLRRIVLGFAVGIGAGWVASLLRRPKDAPAGSSADAAVRMPQEEFGDVVGEAPAEEPALEGAEEIAQEPTAPPRKAVPEMVTPPPGREEEPPEPDAATSEPAKPTKPRAKRAPRKADPAAAVTETVREGREAMNEHLAGLEQAATPPEPDVTRRRRKQP
jgi:type IV secretory pathway VirB10-like protein